MFNGEKKRGRPFAVNPLDTEIKVRFTEEQAKRIAATAARLRVKRADFIRSAVMDAVQKDERER